jgi:hypothetical protein
MGGRPVARMLGAHGAVRLGVLMLLLLLFMLLLLLPLALVKPSVSHAESGWWVPAQSTTWQWQLGSAAVDQSVEAQMYDIDLFENSAEVVSSLHAQGRHVICYLDAGTWEEWRPDAKEFEASVLGNVVSSEYGNERWLDISKLSAIEPIMKARLEMCKQKGFDGVEADNVEGFEVDTGFPLTAAEQLTYNEWLANTAHSLGLSIALKNDRQQAAELEPYFDFALDEECFQSEECGKLEPFTVAGKAVFEVEYNLQPSQFCEQANAAGYMAMTKTKELSAARTPCWPQAQGDWVGAKGSAGYDLAGWDGSGDAGYIPEATVTLAKGSRYVWAPQTTETRALEGPTGSGREAAAYYDANQIEVQLHFNREYKGNLHLYALDWDSSARRETITVDGQTADLTAANFSQGAWVSFPITVAAGATLPITVDRTAGTNAVLSGIFLGEAGPPPAPTVSTAPEGNWVKAVGSAGYDLAGWDGTVGDLSYLPKASLSVQQGTRFQWASNTSDTRALQSPDGLTRSAGAYYDPSQIQLKLSFPEGYTGELHLYAVDWDSTARRETISVDGQTADLSSSFHNGAWVSFPISAGAEGSVTITVSHTGGANAVLSGMFLGEGGTPPTPTVTSLPEGSWVNAVGSGGYDLAGWDGAVGDLSYLPGASLSIQQGSRYRWASNTSDARAMQSPDGLTRSAGAYYDPQQIRLQLSFPSGYKGSLHVYAVDWDSTTRREVVTVDGQTADLSSSFHNGAWLSFPIEVGANETATITVDRTAGANAVLSGVFLGAGGAPPAIATPSPPQGNWVGSDGSAGYALAAWNSTNDLVSLSDASIDLLQGGRYVWAAQTEDPRGLQAPAGLERKAATYYDPNEIQLQLHFASEYNGRLELYAVDWDSIARREVITVDGQTADLSSDFEPGAWVSFPISVAAGQTVSIVVDRTAGVNAVLSGIFLE